MDNLKTRSDYLNEMQPGNIIAFTSADRMVAGRVVSIVDNNTHETITVKTKNGSVYFPKRTDIVWVKTGSRWPIGIYNALKLNKA